MLRGPLRAGDSIKKDYPSLPTIHCFYKATQIAEKCLKHDQICRSYVERGWEKKKNIEVVFDEMYWGGGCSVHMVVRGRKGVGEADRAMPKG